MAEKPTYEELEQKIRGLEKEVLGCRRTEALLRKERDRAQDFLEIAGTMILAIDASGEVSFVNKKSCETLEFDKNEIIGKDWFDNFLPERMIEEARLIFKDLMNGGTELHEFVEGFTILTGTGKEKFMYWHNSVIKDSGGEIIGTFSSGEDITSLKQAEQALRESQGRLSSFMDSATDGFILFDSELSYIDINTSALEMTGLNRNKFIGKNVLDVAPNIKETGRYDKYKKVIKTGVPLLIPDLIPHPKFGIKHVELKAFKVGDGLGIIFTDITDRVQAEEEKKRLEGQLQQATKMEAIGTLAGGIAHEFNNALMGVMGNIELLKMELPEDERRTKYFEAMNESGHRMSHLTDQLLAYSEGGKYNVKNVKLDDFVIETLQILQHDLSPEVRVETHFPKDISYIKADHAQIQMVLSAILANSDEAIEGKGIIKITAENKDVDDDFTKQHPGLKPDSYVCLTIEDDGEGMDEETKNGIFEPFFTTKFQGRGMGMAAVYGIIKSHDGAITVDSEPGKGTVVRIYLPAIEVKEEVKKVKQPEVEIAMGEGTILVIEDEEPLVEMFRQILERLGYRVLEAKTGKQAVELAKTFDGQIDLALLDIKLPDMDGGRVYPLIMEARPDLKVIVCSGYSIHGPAQDILDAGAEGFIQKPFSIVPFADKLKEALEGK